MLFNLKTMSIMEQILASIAQANELAEIEMRRAAETRNHGEFSYRMGETIAFAKCRVWIENAFKHEQGETKDAKQN